ncbi:MAG: hypothetical protein AAF530_15600 [Pseudomonadota bacterium]
MSLSEIRSDNAVRIAVMLNQAVSTEDALSALLPNPWTVGLIAGEGGKRFAVCEAPASESVDRFQVERTLRAALVKALDHQDDAASGRLAIHMDNPYFLGGTNSLWFLRACNDNRP